MTARLTRGDTCTKGHSLADAYERRDRLRCRTCYLTRHQQYKKDRRAKKVEDAAKSKALAALPPAARAAQALHDARTAGAKTYIGLPCKHGHDGMRYTSSQRCCPCLDEQRQRSQSQRPHGPIHRLPAAMKHVEPVRVMSELPVVDGNGLTKLASRISRLETRGYIVQ
jgi:hypothetical protein